MSLILYYHPLSSYCWKALVGLYELDLQFEKRIVDLQQESERAAFAALWPLAKFPVLYDEQRATTVPESSILLEYLDRVSPGPRRLLPREPEREVECRLLDRLFDLYLHLPMQKVVGDRLRKEDQRDPVGVRQAREQIDAAYRLLDGRVGAGPWAIGEGFTLADCAALPALFYADKVAPRGGRWPNLDRYFQRLQVRPSVARVLTEAEPYFAMFPA